MSEAGGVFEEGEVGFEDANALLDLVLLVDEAIALPIEGGDVGFHAHHAEEAGGDNEGCEEPCFHGLILGFVAWCCQYLALFLAVGVC